MEIVHLGKFYWPQKGGMETALRSLAEMGADLGYFVECVVSEPQAKFPIDEDFGKVRVIRYPARVKLLSAPLSFRLLRHRLVTADIIHVHLPNPVAELATLWRLLVEKRERENEAILIPFLHAIPINQGKIGQLWFRHVTSRILDRADTVLISNQNLRKAFPQLGKWDEKIRVLPFFTEAISDQDFARLKAPRADERRALALGRLVPYKGFDVLIRAWKLAQELAPNANLPILDIVGDGPQEQHLRSLIEKLDLVGKVNVHGSCSESEKEEYFARASIFIAPSINRSETFGISILEAMAQGLPVITTDLDTGVELLVRQGLSGAQVKANDDKALADALIRLSSIPADQLSDIGYSNLVFARERYSRAQSTEAYQYVLEQALRRAASPLAGEA